MSRTEIIEHVKRVSKMTVISGPFAGTRIDEQHSWGLGEDVGPQLLGVYEQELHPRLVDFVKKAPKIIIVVGCAEGYYAIGLARLLPDARVFAFDIDPLAREVCEKNAVLNGVQDRVVVSGECTPAAVSSIAALGGPVLAVLDCEGFEREILEDPLSRDALLRADMIIETHPLVAGGDTLPPLVAVLANSHRIEIVRSAARNPNQFPFLDAWPDVDKWLLICENRPRIQNWLICEGIT